MAYELDRYFFIFQHGMAGCLPFTNLTSTNDVSKEYDSRGLLFKRVADPGIGQSNYENAQSFDYAGREVESLPPFAIATSGNTYDRYGRQTESNTGSTDLSSTGDRGEFRSITSYFSSTLTHLWQPQKVTKSYKGSGGAAVTLQESEYTYDSAGRTVSTKSLFKATAYQVEEQDLYPSGQVERSYVPIAFGATPTHNAYSFTRLDKFGRENESGQHDDDVSKSHDLYKSVSTFDLATGWEKTNVQTDFNEDPNAGDPVIASRTTTMEPPDELGRTIKVTDPNGVSHTEYTGNGETYRTYISNTTETEYGAGTQYTYDFGGRVEYTYRGEYGGELLSSWIAKTTSKTSYDFVGQKTEQRQIGIHPADDRFQNFLYDKMGKMLDIVGTNMPSISYEYAYANDNLVVTKSNFNSSLISGVVSDWELEVTKNQLGNVLKKKGLTYPSVGAKEVLFSYVPQGGCGCISQGNPTKFETISAVTADSDTLVEREYDPLGRVILEIITLRKVNGTAGSLSKTTATEYGILGDRTITYPHRPGTSSGPKMKEELRSDGILKEMKIWEGGGWQTVGSYNYSGRQEVTREINDLGGVNQTWVVKQRDIIDSKGNISERKFTIPINSGYVSTASTQGTFSDTASVRDFNGRINKRIQPPTHSGGSYQTNLSSEFLYEGNRIKTQGWNKPSGGAFAAEETYTYNEFGEIETVAEKDSRLSTCDSQLAHDSTLTYTRGLSGNITGYPSELLILNEAVGDLTPRHHESYLGARTQIFDDMNRKISSGYAYTKFQQSATFCVTPPQTSSLVTTEQYQRSKDFEYDIVGNRVKTSHVSTFIPSTWIATSSDDPPVVTTGPVIADSSEEWGSLSPLTQRSVFDGLGRVVVSPENYTIGTTKTFVPYMLAYDGMNRLIAKHDLGIANSAGNSSSAFFRNSESSKVDKYEINRESGGPGAPVGGYSPWSFISSGQSYGTNLFGLVGSRPFNSNGSQETGVSSPFFNEGQFDVQAGMYGMIGDDHSPDDPSRNPEKGGLGMIRGKTPPVWRPEDEWLIPPGEQVRPVGPKCGIDITSQLNLLKNKARQKFFSLGLRNKSGVCNTINTSDGWDIHRLFDTGKDQKPYFFQVKAQRCGIVKGMPKKRCKETVTVSGKCYLAEEVNYFMYGWGWRLCGNRRNANANSKLRFPQFNAQGDSTLAALNKNMIIHRAKKRLGGSPWGLTGRSAWIEAGFYGKLSAPKAIISDCSICPRASKAKFSAHLGDNELGYYENGEKYYTAHDNYVRSYTFGNHYRINFSTSD